MKVSPRAVATTALTLVVVLGLAGCSWLFPPPEVPVVGFAPLESAVHTLVTIVGEGFGDPLPDVAVTFDGVEATLVTWTDTNIIVRIPVLATPTGRRQARVEVRRAGVLMGSGTYTLLRGVLFETDRDGDPEIYLMNPDGTQPTNLTNHPGADTAASWSPDGTKIVFESARDGNWEVYVMGADGADPTNLSNDPDADYFPIWSPDGTRIAFMTDRESSGPPILDASPRIIIPVFNVEVFVMNANGAGQTNLTNSVAWDGYPTWSPDGQKIAFQTNRDDGPVILGVVPIDLGYEIYAVDADGTDAVRLSASPEDDTYPSWSPDGAKIAFQSHRDANAEIYVMNADGTGQLRLTNDLDNDTTPSWSPNGNWVTFHSDRDGNTEIYKTTPAGTSMTRLTNALDTDWGPSWSPDGTQIVFASDRGGNLDIYRMNADGTSAVRLTANSGNDVNAFWDTYSRRLTP